MSHLSLLRARLKWVFLDPWTAWAFLVSVSGAFAVWALGTELALRSYGFALQVIGGLVAAHAIFSNERLFGLPRFGMRFASWCRHFPQRHAVAEGANVTMRMSGSSGAAVTRCPRQDGDPLESQVQKMWLNLTLMDADIGRLSEAVDRSKQHLVAALAKETGQRTTELTELRKLLTSAAAGSPQIAYLGVFLVLAGSAISTYSPELKKLQQRRIQTDLAVPFLPSRPPASAFPEFAVDHT